jgi:hypothetical protein
MFIIVLILIVNVFAKPTLNPEPGDAERRLLGNGQDIQDEGLGSSPRSYPVYPAKSC